MNYDDEPVSIDDIFNIITGQQPITIPTKTYELKDPQKEISMKNESNLTVDDIILGLLKPLMKEWLDNNLPSIVERLVQKEIERISKHGRNWDGN